MRTLLILLTLLLAFAAHELPWVALRQNAGLRIGWMVLVMSASAVVYFGALWVTGLRLKAFLKR